MTSTTLDHIVVAAPNLKAGVEWVRDILDAVPEFGGQHPRMGTHNCLLSLGGKTYLEVISPDPNASQPDRPRWFGLDEMQCDAVPRLAAWVARTDDIVAVAAGSSEPLGSIESMSRGELNWQITLTDDGAVNLGGAAPILIQWPLGMHPSTRMRDSRCTLVSFELQHPETRRVMHLLQSIGLEDAEVNVTSSGNGMAPRIVAHIQTARGEKTLSME